jgi:hypothetical protein
MLASSTGESEVPLRSHGSLSLNRALMAAGLVAPSIDLYGFEEDPSCLHPSPHPTRQT